MTLYLDVICAWASVILVFMLLVIWILRLGIKHRWFSPKSFLGRMNRSLRISHRWLGVLFIVVALAHGIFSSEAVLSLNFGTACFAAGLVLGVMYLFKRKMKRKVWMALHRAFSVLVVGLLVLHLIDVGGAPATKLLIASLKSEQTVQAADIDTLSTDEETELVDWANASDDATYQDGTYTGTAEGYGQDLTVEVVIASGQIEEISIVSHNEVGEMYYESAMEQIPAAIVAAQSVDVDSISGATYTSVGIKNAVADALNQAILTGETVETEELPEDGERHNRGGGH